jgi:hypothetical protein
MAVSISPFGDYSKRESQASTKVARQLKGLRQKAAAENWTFEVGYTAALDFSLPQITGMVAPEDWQSKARQQNDSCTHSSRLETPNRASNKPGSLRISS